MANINDESVSKLVALGDEKIGKLLPLRFVCTCFTGLRISYSWKWLKFLDMIAATSVLQIRASEIRQSQINWQSYLQ